MRIAWRDKYYMSDKISCDIVDQIAGNAAYVNILNPQLKNWKSTTLQSALS